MDSDTAARKLTPSALQGYERFKKRSSEAVNQAYAGQGHSADFGAKKGSLAAAGANLIIH